MTTPILLIVDDEKNTRDGLRMALEDEFDCYVASDIAQATSILNSENVDIMLTDLRMGADSGMDLLEISKKLPNPPVSIMMTAYGSVDTAVEAMRRGAWHFVTKPLNIDEVELLAKRALHVNQKTVKENSVQPASPEQPSQKKKKGSSDKGPLSSLIGTSPEMKHIHSLIEQVAPTKTTIFIEGESGTGKELVAQAIHRLSTRSKEKIITVNCAALSPQLLESELFGHEKGAFTGANQKRIGRFEQANGGTLFLDEIGEIDASTQVKLLRVLSEKTIERVGSSTPIKVDVRILTATNKNLEEMVAEGSFRQDLYFRLNVVKITTPPLRSRADDILLLADHFLEEFAKENNKSNKPLSEQAAKTLKAYSWPGNVRELRTTIEHGVVMSNENRIKLNHLPSRIQVNEQVHTNLSTLTKSTTESTPTPDNEENLNLAELERKTIRQALEKTAGNRTVAARLLGISRRTLHRKINGYENEA